MFSDMPKPIQGSGETNEDGYMFTFTPDELINATATSTPIVLYGDFSNVKTIMYCGTYYCGNLPSVNTLYLNVVQNITASPTGTPYTLETGSSSETRFTGYRDITLYPDRVEIGSGYYQNHQDDYTHGYGALQVLTLSNSELYV